MFAVKDINTNKYKYVTRLRCKVIDNRDPQTKGRIKVDNPLLGESPWIPYLQTGYIFDIPEIGDLVYVEADGGFETHTIAWGKIQTNLAETTPMPDFFQRTVPTNRGFYSPKGHSIQLDDGEVLVAGVEPTTSIGVRIVTTAGNSIKLAEDPGTDLTTSIERSEGQSVVIDGLLDSITMTTAATQSITMSATGGIVFNDGAEDTMTMAAGVINLTNAAGATINMSETGEFTFTDTPGNNISTGTSGISATDFIGNSVTTSSSGISATASTGEGLSLGSGTASVSDATSTGLTVNNGKITLGGPTAEVLDLFDQTLQQVDAILTAIQALTVPTAVGPSGIPANVAQFVQAQVATAQIKTLLGTIKG